MKKYIFSLFLMLALILSFVNIYNSSLTKLFASDFLPNNIQSSAKAVAVIDQDSNRLLLSKNENLKLAMASTTKIMTCLVALENCENIDKRFVIDNNAVGTYGSSMYLKKDEEVSMKELLYGLMLVSGNDAAMAIASHIGKGDINYFVSLMNKKAAELKCSNTHFDNPHGLDSESHFTTALDLAVITSYAMKNETFKQIVGTKTIKMGERFLKNKQKLLFTLEGTTGVKTGFTDNALRCSVSSFSSSNLNLICVVLNCPDMFEESERLINLANSLYKNYEILKPYTALEYITIKNGKQDKTWAVNKEGLKYPLLKKERGSVQVVVNSKTVADAPINNGSIIGKVKIYVNNVLIFETNLCTIEEIEKENVFDKANKILQELF